MQPMMRATVEPQSAQNVRTSLYERFAHEPEWFRQFGISSRDELQKALDTAGTDEVWKNDHYTCWVHRHDKPIEGWPNMIHLSIKRNDKQPLRDWRHMQQIKNDVIGPENEAVELYPAEARKVDLANQFHLWVIEEAGVRFPFGFTSGAIDYDMPTDGAVQRALADEAIADAIPEQTYDQQNAQLRRQVIELSQRCARLKQQLVAKKSKR